MTPLITLFLFVQLFLRYLYNLTSLEMFTYGLSWPLVSLCLVCSRTWLKIFFTSSSIGAKLGWRSGVCSQTMPHWRCWSCWHRHTLCWEIQMSQQDKGQGEKVNLRFIRKNLIKKNIQKFVHKLKSQNTALLHWLAKTKRTSVLKITGDADAIK